MPNRLAGETSPYLLQHVDNPVDWMPWSEEVFARAETEGKPVFLSVGYSSCHWCHVMAHESFEDLEVASLLNRRFISVKVDREERPDVDEAYMTAVQLQSGRGGWPMSAFLTPDKAPFFAGTYFPKPSFLSLLRQIEAAWTSRREEVEASAREFREALESSSSHPAPMARHSLSPDFLISAFEAIASDFDPVHGGFGGAPKFPPHGTLAFLFGLSESKLIEEPIRHRSRGMALDTLAKMLRGGIHDHIGGGFHRYSTDAVWLVPHFEKMLYDNALMLANIVSFPNAPEFMAAAQGIVRWLREEMLTSDGLFGTALDADSEGEEGKFYTWRVEEVRDVLEDRADAFLTEYRFEEAGNYRDEATQRRTEANIPHLGGEPPVDRKTELRLLREARSKRVRPLFDHKGLVGLNGLAIAGLSKAGEREFAETLFNRIERFVPAGGPLPRQITEGTVSGLGFLEDYAGMLWGWASLAKGSLAEFEGRFGSREAFRDLAVGDYFNTADFHESLFGRTKSTFDQPVPSGNGLMARALVRLGEVDEARRIVDANLGWIERAPGATGTLLVAGLEILEGGG